MVLTDLLNSFRNLAINTRSVFRPTAASLIGNGSRVFGGILSPVLLDFVRGVGKQNPIKYKRGLRSRCLRRWVDKPEKYTTNKISFRKLGGRDPETGRVVVSTIGGGHRQKYRWVLFTRNAPRDGEPVVERIHSINYDPLRTAKIALAVNGDQKRWILASSSMKSGDLIKTSSEIPKIPVRPQEGDAWPLGALPLGTVVHNVEMFPTLGGCFARAAGTCCQVLRKVGDRVVVQVPSKREVSLSQECMATIGRVSNVDHNKEHIGSAQRNRWLGNRPHSGLWHRKDGYCGRKVRPLPPLKVYDKVKKPDPPIYKLTMN